MFFANELQIEDRLDFAIYLKIFEMNKIISNWEISKLHYH